MMMDFSDTVHQFNMLHHFSTKYEIRDTHKTKPFVVLKTKRKMFTWDHDQTVIHRAIMLYDKITRLGDLLHKNNIVACVCLVIASKYEEVDNLFFYNIDHIKPEVLIETEKEVLSALDLQAFIPCPIDYLNIFNEVLTESGQKPVWMDLSKNYGEKDLSAMEMALEVVKYNDRKYKVIKEFIQRYNKSISSLHFKNVRGIGT
jgi:hypothetical protein